MALQPDFIDYCSFRRGVKCHARTLLSGIQADDWQFIPMGLLDSRQKRAGMTGVCSL
jgi:hypothetical protein